MTRKGYSAAIAAALAALLAASCQQIFTTSLVKGLARDPSSYKFPANLAVSDAAYYLAQSQGDPAVAAALVTPLFNAVQAATPGSPAYDQAAQLLAEAVVQSSNFGKAIANSLVDIASDLSSVDEDILFSLLQNFSVVSLTSNEVDALQLIGSTVPFPATISADQAYAIAAVLFLQAVATAPDVELQDFDPHGSLTGFQITQLESQQTYVLAQDFLAKADLIADGDKSLLGSVLSTLGDLIDQGP